MKTLREATRGKDRPKQEAAAGRRSPPQCDEVDRRLIELLVEDVRASNKLLAEKTGISVWTVADRLRRLREDRVLAATVVVDWKLAGFEADAFAFVRVEGGSAGRVTESLIASPNFQSVVRTLGSVDVIGHVLAENPSKLRAIADEIGDIRGVYSVELHPVVEYHRLTLNRQTLPLAPWSPRDLPNPAVSLDELDGRMIARLAEDGHQSNREIARQLGVSENTIRNRLRRLEESGLLRVVAMFDPFVLGEATVAYFTLRTRGAARRDVLARLSARDETPAVITCLGAHDLLGLYVSSSFDEIARGLEDLRSLPGVHSLTAFPIVGVMHNRANLTRLL